ncbi:MAG: bifunctional diaminohydroxyphosphoribosylaminopyrimidine deaminase/5-amino-6-(5-phosphoribosylamino)uracil reductase RibD [Alphaproteobacteria bacterium]
MRTALALAARALGRAWPNPAVGCVLADATGRVVGRGWTQAGGRPHAETEALGRAGAAARGATAYVSLEPCSHHGATPPCADAFVAAGIARAVIAIEDPDPRVNGAGIARLKAAGIAVELGVGAEEAAELNAGFFHRIKTGRPLLTLKCATTLDGRIATHRGDSQWITGETARAWVHGMRARHDAVMIGIGTALADDPLLTCRLPGLEAASPVRIVVDGRLRLSLTSQLVRGARAIPTWLVTRTGGDAQRADAYRQAGVEVIELPADTGDQPPIGRILAECGRRGLTRILVEGGSHLTAACFAADVVDRIAWFRAPSVTGGDGVPVAQPFGVDRLADMRRYERIAVRPVGQDILETYRRRD